MDRFKIDETLVEFPPEAHINNLSDLAKHRIEKRAIKLTIRGSGLTNKEATKAVKTGTSWAAITKQYTALRNLTAEITHSVLVFANLSAEDLTKSGLTVSDLSSFKDDLRYFTEKLNSIDIANQSGKITSDNLLQFNHIVIAVNDLATDMFRILTPIQTALLMANSTYKQSLQETNK